MSQRILQIYCGRWQQANVIDHPGRVLALMAELDWVEMAEELGLTTIYLLGLWDVTGPIIVTEEEGMDLNEKRNRCGSAFAISDHNKVWPLLGTNDELKELVNKIQMAGLKVIVDVVANHTATNHRWVGVYTEIYKKDSDDRMKAAFSGDVFELNYESGLTRKLMEEVIIGLVNMGIDGFRCDMAHLVPESFWAQVITQAKTINSKIWFGAEAYEQSVFSHENRDRLIRAGFGAMYDSGLYENIKAMRNSSDVSGIVSHLNYVNQFEPETWIHYFGNHDDSFPLKPELTEVYAALISSLKGSWLIFNGSLSGQNHRLAHHYIEILEERKTGVDSVSLKLKQFLKRRNELGPIVEEFVAEGHTIRSGANWFDLESGDYGY